MITKPLSLREAEQLFNSEAVLFSIDGTEVIPHNRISQLFGDDIAAYMLNRKSDGYIVAGADFNILAGTTVWYKRGFIKFIVEYNHRCITQA